MEPEHYRRIAMDLQAIVKHIELWLIDKLIPFARNPRTHSEAQVAQIAASIAEFGFNNPILVDTKAGIIAGHGRLAAARKLAVRAWQIAHNAHGRRYRGAAAYALSTSTRKTAARFSMDDRCFVRSW